MGQRLKLSVLAETFCICRLERDTALPPDIYGLDFFSVTRTSDELSVVVSEEALSREELPAEAEVEGGWACLKVEGPLELSMVGVLAALSEALAESGVPLFAVSTYETDYLLLKREYLERAISALSDAGHVTLE